MTQASSPDCFDWSDYIGIPYAENGENTGLNCWELVELIMIEVFDVMPPHYVYTGEYKDVAPIFCSELSAWMNIPYAKREPGDLLLLNIAGYPVHLGILVSPVEMVHTLRATGSCIERINTPRWRKRISGVYRWMN